MRKLLPYEHQLIEALGVTKEEYLNFVAIQKEYKDPKVGTVFDIRCDPATQTTVALVLTIVGTLFQVGAALLAPKPEVPGGGRRQNRQQRFAPSFGFNSTQELASYGDPVNLVYTNQNPLGNVRVSTSLVWSAIDNFGSTQFMRLLLVVGASTIKNIKYTRTAFGQTGLSDLDRSNVFIFNDSGGGPGIPLFSDLNNNFGDKDSFPKILQPSDPAGAALRLLTPFNDDQVGNTEYGFSQAYTPTTSTSLGVYDPIPLNVELISRQEDGDREDANLGIVLNKGTENNNSWINNKSDNGASFAKDQQIEICFEDANYDGGDKTLKDKATDMRRKFLETLDFGSIYMLGTAKFKLSSYGDSRVITSNSPVKVKFKCVESGQIPGTSYATQEPVNNGAELKKIRKTFTNARRILKAKNEDFSSNEILARNMIIGNTYVISDITGTDFTETGATKNEIGEIFVCTKRVPTDGKVSNASIEDVEVNDFSFRFIGEEKITWQPQFLASVSRSHDKLNGAFFNSSESNPFSPKKHLAVINTLAEQEATIFRNGSIKYTKSLKEDNSDDPPALETLEFKGEINDQIARLRKLIKKIQKGEEFDGGDTEDVAGSEGNRSIFQCENTFVKGFKANPENKEGFGEKNQSIFNQKISQVYEKWNNRSDESKQVPNVGTGVDDGEGTYWFTFIYIDSTGRWNLFNFNGLQTTESSPPFPNDDKLIKRRNRLTTRSGKKYKEQKNSTKIDQKTTTIKKEAIKEGEFQIILNKQTGLNSISFSESDELSSKYKSEENARISINTRVSKLFSKRHDEAIEVIEKDIALLEELRSEVITSMEDNDGNKSGDKDRVGTRAIRRAYNKLIREKEDLLGLLDEALGDWDGYSQSFDNNFFSKCLVKAETASYTTLSESNLVNFSFKTRLFRRISGRQKKYGDETMREYSESDNGVKSRIVFFRMSYERCVSDGETANKVILPYIFAIRHGSESDFYTQISFYNNKRNPKPSKWKFNFKPVFDIVAEKRDKPFKNYLFLEDSDELQKVRVGTKDDSDQLFDYIFWRGRKVGINENKFNYPSDDERGPIYTNEWDMFSVNSDTQTEFSFESGPEIQLTAVTEQQFDESFTSSKYQNLSKIGIGVFANRGLQDLRSITVLVKNGKLCRTVENIGVNTVPENSSSYAPDIFVDTLLDKENGIGNYIEEAHLDKDSLVLAKNFCKNNNLPRQGEGGKIDLFMDGVIADTGSWREFWINNAPFSLLELARKNGKDTLVPALPVDTDGKAADDDGLPVVITISALFTAGNILEGSYKEEFLDYGASTEDLIASVIYREYESRDLFSQNRSVEVKLKDASPSAIRETFDLSQFVTQREQAIMFGKLLCNQRRKARKGVEFRTLPFEAGLEPGGFIYVDVGLKTWDNYSSGVVMENGELNLPLNDNPKKGTHEFSFLLYHPSTGTVESLSEVSVTTTSEGISTATFTGTQQYEGWMFVLGKEPPNKRVFRVTELAIEEGGELSVKAIEYPCFEEPGVVGTRAHIADFRSTNFVVS
tara:strand:+ start:7 stop:4581 length:4575 start_codon:yes stop_codon:yes gene_type:complete